MAKVKITGHASGTGILTVTAPNTSTDRTITLPDATGTLLNSDGSGASLTALNATQLTSGTVPDARFPATLPAASGVNLTALNATQLTTGTIPIARIADDAVTNAKMADDAIDSAQIADGAIDAVHLASGVGGKVLSYAAGQIQMTSNIAHSGSCTITATGVTFAITSTVTNSNFIISASGWTPHRNPTSSGGNYGSGHWLYRQVNSGGYTSATTYPVYSDYITGNPAYNWDELTGHCHVYDSALTHTAGDTITYQFYVEPYNCSDSGYFNHLGGGSSSSAALTLNWSILEVN